MFFYHSWRDIGVQIYITSTREAFTITWNKRLHILLRIDRIQWKNFEKFGNSLFSRIYSCHLAMPLQVLRSVGSRQFRHEPTVSSLRSTFHGVVIPGKLNFSDASRHLEFDSRELLSPFVVRYRRGLLLRRTLERACRKQNNSWKGNRERRWKITDVARSG